VQLLPGDARGLMSGFTGTFLAVVTPRPEFVLKIGPGAGCDATQCHSAG